MWGSSTRAYVDNDDKFNAYIIKNVCWYIRLKTFICFTLPFCTTTVRLGTKYFCKIISVFQRLAYCSKNFVILTT